MNSLIILLIFSSLCHAQQYSLKTVMEVRLSNKIGQLRAVPVKIGNKYPHAIAVMYSEEAEVDPWEGHSDSHPFYKTNLKQTGNGYNLFTLGGI